MSSELRSVEKLDSDGVWFQAVEGEYDMTTAKRLNDTCWTRYSPCEAERIKKFLNLDENSGLEVLKEAQNIHILLTKIHRFGYKCV
ncbi:MAG: hypothetical protein GWN94_01675 [Phycisphaerae bacterium]|nr:hypothetical protein [Phycisphaerae bacterium]